MPEGDTVYLSAKLMHGALAGRVLTQAELRVPRHATADLVGMTVTEVVPRGKHMLTRFDSDLTLHTHFKMEGSWRRYQTGAPWTGGPDWQIRAILGNAEMTAVGYRLAIVELLKTPDEHTVVGHLGPDTLGPDWDEDEAVRRVGADPARPVAEALLDQRNLAGIGNLYKCELLFLRGISPWTPVGEVNDLRALIRLGRRLLVANKDQWDQVTTGDTRRNRQTYVFGRQREACRRCRTPIRHDKGAGTAVTDRESWWCPNCQPGPMPAARRAERTSRGGRA